MDKLIELSNYINSYNLISSTSLKPIRLAFLQKHKYEHVVGECLQQMECEQICKESKEQAVSGYMVFRALKVQGMDVRVVKSLQDEENIEDDVFLKRKKIIEKLRITEDIIFVHFQEEKQIQSGFDQRSEAMQLKRVNISTNKEVKWKGNHHTMYLQIIRVWQAINRFQLIGCLQKLKSIIKQQSKEKERQQQWLLYSQGNADPITYAFKMINLSNDYLLLKYSGYYSRETYHFQNVCSVHWQIMDILQDLWREEADRLHKQIQRMPLTYIGDSIRMSDYHSIGGFLPETCFLRVFKPLLECFADSLVVCLQGIKFKVIHTLQTVYDYYFSKTTIKQIFTDQIIKQIEEICDNFLKQTTNAIYSQISYVYAPAQAFWEMKNFKSNLFSPEQQANIQIKYIGRIYVKRVFDSIRQSIPRLLGQGLLRKVSAYISSNSLKQLLQIIRQIPFKIQLNQSELNIIVNKTKRTNDCSKLIKYFSLKVKSTYLIKNLLQKHDQRWKQMYCRTVEPNQNKQEYESHKPKKGFMAWMKKLFTKQSKIHIKRSNSHGKQSMQQQSNKDIIINKQQKLKEHEPAITEKVWILLINTSKKIQDQRIERAASEGFPSRLRSAIWYWLAKKQIDQEKQIKLIDILDNSQMNQETARQIQKDLGRTPPSQLFHKKMRTSLRRVLHAYSLLDVQIGYTQGMNFFVALIIATLINFGVKDDYLSEHSQKPNLTEIQQKAFTIFRCMMFKNGLRKMMFIERQHIAEICYRIQQKIKETSQTVSNLIEQSGFTCQIIFGPILISGLSTWSKNLLVGRRIIDLLMGRGFSVLYKVIAGVTLMSEERLLRLKNEQIYDFLRNKALDILFDSVGDKGLTELFLQIQ